MSVSEEEQERDLPRSSCALHWDMPPWAPPTWVLHWVALDEGVRTEGVWEHMSSVRTVYSVVEDVSGLPLSVWRWYCNGAIKGCVTHSLSCDTQPVK